MGAKRTIGLDRGFTLIARGSKGARPPCRSPKHEGFTLIARGNKGARPPCRSPKHEGFTLIEVMVVVVILGLLAAIIVPRVMSRPDEARVVAARADIAAITQALKLYRLDNTFYPATEQGLAALVQRPTTQPVPGNWKQGGYLDRVPKDPWGREYQYLNPGVRGEIDVFSLGADGAPGGEGNGADVFN